MQYDMSEIDSKPAITSYEEEPTYWEAVKAEFTLGIIDSHSNAKGLYWSEEKTSNMDKYASVDPDNASTYSILKAKLPTYRQEQFDALYDAGKFEIISGHREVGDAYLKFRKELEGKYSLPSLKEMGNIANEKAIEEYKSASRVAQQSDSMTAAFLGRGGEMFTDPLFLGSLAFGGGSAVGKGILGNAGKAFLTEAAIETGLQAIVAPTVYSYKKELGIKTSIMQEATNAVVSIASAGTIRAAGSTIIDIGAKALGKGEFAPALVKDNMDLTEEGIAVLRSKDPELADDYVSLQKSQATEDLEEHAMNLQEVENGVEITEIKNPNAKGEELNSAEPIPEIKNSDIIEPMQRLNNDDMAFVSGKDMDGNVEFKSYKEVKDELDLEADYIKKAEDCLL